MEIAILILHHNTPDLTKKLADGIPGSIVIDNGSDPNKGYVGDHQVIHLDHNHGFSGGWNAGIKILRQTSSIDYEAFWLLNSDIIMDKISVDRFLSVVAMGEFDIITPSYNCWIKDCQPDDSNMIQEVPLIEFTAPCILSKVFDKIGYLDAEIFPLGYGVEYDFILRAKKEGFKVWVDKSSPFEHIGSQTIKQIHGLKSYTLNGNKEHVNGMVKKYGQANYNKIMNSFDMKSDFSQKIAVYTTIFGNYDDLKPHPWSQINAKWYCITDNKDLKCEGWETIVVKYPRPDLHPRMRAKFHKLFPWESLPSNIKISIFIDGTTHVLSENFIEYCILYLYNDMVLYKHPWRDCIYEELIESRKLQKYEGEIMEAQIEEYKKTVNRHSGLYACGLLVRKHTDLIKNLMKDWWVENTKWSYQDQLSFPVVCQRNNFTPTTFHDNQVVNNQHVKYDWHNGK